jgi:hypothetical protein
MKGTVRLEASSAIIKCGDKDFTMTYSDDMIGKELFIALLLSNAHNMGMTEMSIVVFDLKSRLYDTLIIDIDDDRVDENMFILKGFIYVKNDVFILSNEHEKYVKYMLKD